jgi:hypothetical protein
VLHSVAELAQHGGRQVERVLGDEVDAHALGADQADHCFHLLYQGAGRVAEEHVGFVVEKSGVAGVAG